MTVFLLIMRYSSATLFLSIAQLVSLLPDVRAFMLTVP